MAFGADGQFANSTEDITSVFVPNTVQIDERTIQDIQSGAFLEHLFVSAYNNTPNVEAIYFATPREVVRYYPNINLGAVLPPDFAATGRIWYSGSTSENNPEKKPWWTPPYVDATGRGLVTTAAAPVYSNSGNLVGVVGLDLTLQDVRANVESTRFLRSGYSFLIDNTGHTVALPDQGFRDIFGRDPQEGDINLDLTQTPSAFSPFISRMITGESGFERFEIGGRSLFIAFAPLESTGWSIGSVIEAEDVLSSIATLQSELNNNARSLLLTRILPISAIIFILVTLLGLLLTTRLVTPIQKLAAEAQKIGEGEWEINLPLTGNDEIGVLARAFQVMVEQIHEFIRDLETRVAERTRDLERRSTQLQVAAEIAREATAIHDLDELLELAVNLIRGRFGFYHAGIFLVDDKNEFAILSAATGEPGREMLLQGHKLKIGQVGMVGYVTGTGQPRIALDVERDPTHYQNPLLPETRSEMTLPLKVGERIIGALDVQSQNPDAFSEDDIAIMQVVADQLAVAIENARLIQDSQEMVRQLEKLYGNYSLTAWKELADASITVGYQYDQRGVHPLRRDKSVESGPIGKEWALAPVKIPILVRGQVVATLEAWPQDADMDPEAKALLETIVERLGQTLENARLFSETQQRAEIERLVSEVTGRIRETMDIQTILQTAAIEIRQALDLSEAEIRLSTPPPPARPSDNGDHSNSEEV
jgi:GAF domain-containing protein/HAMP domain-containing protein